MSKPVTPQEMFDLWQKMMNPSGYPLQSLMFPVLDPAEIEKKIQELEAVEHWLKANLGMLQLTIKSLEYQRSLLKSGEKIREAMEGEGEEGDAPNPAAWAWNVMAEASRGGAAAMKAAKDERLQPKSKPKPRSGKKRA